MQRDRERQLHDYIDGRLSDAEREEFEAALALDASLAAKVASYRATGDAIRHGDDQLGEGFYAEARERFETTRRPWIERLWSWEAASVLAAAALAFALFLPMMFDDGVLDNAPGTAAAMDELDQVAPQAETDEPALEGAPPAIVRQDVAEKLVDEVEAAPAPPRPERELGVAAPSGRSEVAKKAETRNKELPKEPAPMNRRATAENFKSVASATSSDHRRDLAFAVVRMPQAPPVPIALPTLEEWRQMGEDPRFQALADLGNPTAARRMLWVGERIDCDRLMPTVEDGEWRLELHPGEDIACALTIPADGLPVRAVADPAS